MTRLLTNTTGIHTRSSMKAVRPVIKTNPGDSFPSTLRVHMKIVAIQHERQTMEVGIAGPLGLLLH